MNVLMLACFSCKASVWYAFLRIGSKGNTTPAFLTQVGFIVCMLGGPQECHCRGWDFVMKEWCFLIQGHSMSTPLVHSPVVLRDEYCVEQTIFKIFCYL